MKYLKFLAVLLGAAATTAFASEESPAADADVKTNVVQLKTDNFDQFIKEHPLALVKFYAPWCGHCKALAPEYEKAADTLVASGKDLPLVKVDCTEEADLCQKHEVQGYPTVKLFKGEDAPITYPGGRNADAIVSFMTKQALPPVSVIETKDFDSFKTQDKVVVVAYLSEDDKANTDLLNSVADAHRLDYLFGSSSDAALAEKEGVKAPAVVIYRSFDEPKVVYDGKLEKDELVKFIKSAATPLIGEVGPETYQGYMAAGIPLAYLFVEKDAKNKAELVEAITPIAKEFKGKINFATIDATAFGAHAPNLNLEQGKWPAFAIQETAKNAKYPFAQDKEITREVIEAFVRDFDAGKIDPSIKSEEIPTEQTGPVRVVVAKSYEEEVINNEKDVLLEIYAPWCGHCKALAPKYEELAALYATDEFKDKVVVAKVDATVNDLPLDIQGFPTIKLFPAGSKSSPVDYAGSRTVEDLANFIRDNGKYKADAYVAPPAEETAKEAEPEKAEEAAEKAEEAKEEKKDAHDEL